MGVCNSVTRLGSKRLQISNTFRLPLRQKPIPILMPRAEPCHSRADEVVFLYLFPGVLVNERVARGQERGLVHLVIANAITGRSLLQLFYKGLISAVGL